jgi:Flp pilus assembly protein protease CpaA
MLFEEGFLIVLGTIWIIFATCEDLKRREIANWVNFSLVIFALGFRFFWSLFNVENLVFFYQGVIGFVIFFVLGNLLYYSKVFAGGDAKLMIALGAILPLSFNFTDNLSIFIWFFVLFLIVGAIYGIIFSVVMGVRNMRVFKSEFARQFRRRKKFLYSFLIIGMLLVVFSFMQEMLFYLAILVFILPYFYLGAKSIDEACMVKLVNPEKLTAGDWLYKDIKIGKKLIRAKWEGLNEEEIDLLRKTKKKVMMREGIPFTPVFLISFLILVVFWKLGFLFLFF